MTYKVDLAGTVLLVVNLRRSDAYLWLRHSSRNGQYRYVGQCLQIQLTLDVKSAIQTTDCWQLIRCGFLNERIIAYALVKGAQLEDVRTASTVSDMSAAKGAAYMPKKTVKAIPRKIVLRLPDLDHAKSSVLKSLGSPRSRRNYKFAMEQFIIWYCSELRLALNCTVVLRFRLHLESLGLAAGTINQRLAAVTRLAFEGGLRPVEPGTRCRDSTCQRRQAARLPVGKLAQPRAS
jgi:hypothetical protein